MIKLFAIDRSIEADFLRCVRPPFERLLSDFRARGRFPNITDYFFSGDTLNARRVEEVLVGEIECLLSAIDAIGAFGGKATSSPQKEFLALYHSFTATALGRSLCDRTGVKVCPYCNRSYIHTLRFHRVRPQFDHFFGKVKYPYLAVSLYNLIPCCAICNQSKADADVYDPVAKTYTFLYPYRDEYGTDVRFETSYTGDVSYLLGKNENFELKIGDHSSDPRFRANLKRTQETLHTQELYQKHKDVVLDIIRASTIYDKPYMQNLLDRFPNLFRDLSDVERLVYMNETEKEHWGDRVLAKLTHDIVREFRNGQ